MPGTAMTTLLDDDWTVRPKTSVWETLMPGTGLSRSVRLPHDALVARARSAKGAGRIAHYPDGEETEYLHTLTAPAEWADRIVLLEVEAAQRSAKLFLNDVQLAAWHHGTTPRLIRLDRQLRPGQANEIRIETRTGSDSRWYAGAGLIRDVRLHVLPLVHLDPTSPFATTEDVDDERAVVRFDVEYEPGELTAVAYSGGAETGRDTIASTSGPTRLVALAESEEVSAGPEGVVFIPIELRDDARALRVRETAQVSVSVEGPAELVGVVSANPVNEEPVTAAGCRTHAGRALAAVRPTGPGTITMTVCADGLETVTATVTAVAADAH